MATKILVRRGVVEDLTEETLDEGELAFTTDTLGLYVGSDKTELPGYIKVNSTEFIEYDGNALTSATDTNNLKEAVENIDVALKAEQDLVAEIESNLGTTAGSLSTLEGEFDEHTHGTINNNGTLTAASVTPATGDELVVVDADDDNLKKAIAIDTEGTGYLKEDGTWSMPDVEDLANVTLTNVANGNVLKYLDGDWVNSSDIDVNTTYTLGIAGTTWSAPGGSVYDGEAVTLDASTGEDDDVTIKFIKGSSRMVISNPATGVVVLNSLPRPFTVNTNDALGVDEEITLTEGHNIVITETGGAIEIKTPETLTLNKIDDVDGSSSYSILFKNKWFQGGSWVDGDNELYVNQERDLIFKPASDSAKRVIHSGNISTELFSSENTFTADQRFQGDVTLGARNQAGYDPSYKLRFESSSAASPQYIDMYVDTEGVLVTDDGTNISAVGGLFPSITTQSGTEVVGGVTYDSAIIDFEIGSATASVELIEGSNTQITNVETGKIAINSRLRPVKVNGTQMLDANSLDTEDLDLTDGDNITITEANGVVTFDVADITTATQSALDLKADLDSPELTGTPKAPTPTQSTHIANKGYVDTAINDAVFGDVAIEWQLEGEQSGEVLPSGFNVFIDDITWDFANYDYKVVFDFETAGEDNDQPYMRFNGLTSSSTSYNYLYKRTSSVNDSVTVASGENTSLIYFGAELPTSSASVGQTQYQGEFIIRRSVNGAPTQGSPIHNYSVRGFASVTAVTAPISGFTGYPVESTFVGNFGSSGVFTSIDIYPSISAGTTDYAKARIYKRAK